MPARFFIAALFAVLHVLMTAATAQPASPSSYGIVETVREVQVAEDLPGVAAAFEHAYKPCLPRFGGATCNTSAKSCE